jgi:hypothetical protein
MRAKTVVRMGAEGRSEIYVFEALGVNYNPARLRRLVLAGSQAYMIWIAGHCVHRGRIFVFGRTISGARFGSLRANDIG